MTAQTMTGGESAKIPNWLEAASRNHPGKLALAFGEERWTFAELRTRVESAAGTIAAAMPERSGRIGILSGNRPGFVMAVHAAVRLGIPFVPLNWRLSHAELAWQIADAGITLLVADEALDAARAVQLPRGIAVAPIASFEQMLAQPPPSSIALQDGGEGAWADLSAAAAVIYTSGTSGRPKGAVLTYGNLWFGAIASALHLGSHADDVWLATMPLFHVGGLAILLRGAIGAVPVVLHERFAPERAIGAIEEGATLVSVVPTMLERILNAAPGQPWPPHLRCVLLGGSPAPPPLIERCLRLGIPVAPTYGLTEAASQVATLLPNQVRDRPGSSGLPLPFIELRIRTAQGLASAGAIGEIEIRGPTVFHGYLTDGAVRDPRDWFATGDVGALDADGYLTVVDRRSDLIVSGGENIYPAEIERVLCAHPLVVDAGAIGTPHETWGQRPVAAVVWRGDPTAVDSELRRHCAQELSSYKTPDRFVPVAELPRSASGKLLRRVLAEQILVNQSD